MDVGLEGILSKFPSETELGKAFDSETERPCGEIWTNQRARQSSTSEV